MGSQPPGRPALVLRALSALRRRHLHWCQVCRLRLAARTSGPRSGRRPDEVFLFVDAPDEFMGYARVYARYLCDGCRRRNSEAEAAARARADTAFAAAVGRFAA